MVFSLKVIILQPFLVLLTHPLYWFLQLYPLCDELCCGHPHQIKHNVNQSVFGLHIASLLRTMHC